ncbi:M3 family oligoendopeptidase [Fundicoccus sp. Sow4_D5]|uniref:M3 family oligoendopeptidase n=1 Tax=Fundicoccus sp. Sow4_D5 TaxID=3438782 RepID=UPI003F916EC6
MYEWQLDDLYSSYESEAFQQDLASLAGFKDEMAVLTLEDTIESVKAVIDVKERLYITARRLSAFISLNLSTKATDEESTNYQNVLSNRLNQLTKLQAQTNRFLGDITVDTSQDPELADYDFYLKEMKKHHQYLLSDEVEEALSKIGRSAGQAWSSLQGFLTSQAEADFRGENKTLSELRNLAYAKEADVRREAYQVELALYDQLKDPIAFSLNNIKSQVLDVSEMRGYSSPLEQTLIQSRMSEETLDALLTAIKESLPTFRRYLKHKARVLGHKDGLPFYDLFAPMGESSQTFTVEETKTYLVDKFSQFAPDLAEMTAVFYEKNYMDFYPRKGKRGGAFCANLPFISQSRIMLNFDGTLNNVLTIAHELGHAYHGTKIQSHRPLNWSYSMPVAETASTFNEAILINHLLAEAATDDEKVAVIEQYLQDVTQIIVDIYSRYLFETAVFDKRQASFMFAPQLADLMLNAQKEAYGDGLDENTLHPYMWINKSHYYSSGLSFYNFPYAFGGLFSRGLYERYLREPENFVEQYGELLTKTTVASVEETAAVMDIDVTNVDFWRMALQGIDDYVDQFIELTSH